jgi:peptidoglycan hydrolase-like protein with peptidoglycan-binding domain
MKPIVMHNDHICRRDNVLGGLPATGQLIGIDLPVGSGFKAKNLDSDVRTIQKALNQIKPLHGGPTVPLAVDGKCGPKTNSAIWNFQFKQFKAKGADGLIEPGKQTIQRIHQLLFSNAPVDPSANEAIRKRVVAHLGLVAKSVHAAQATLLLANSPGGAVDMGQSAAKARLDRHFALNTLSSAARAQAIRDIHGVFTMYSNVLSMPGALGRRAFFAIDDSEFCAFIMLHEMAHFVGFPGGGLIDDNGRGWFTDDTHRPAAGAQAVAECGQLCDVRRGVPHRQRHQAA